MTKTISVISQSVKADICNAVLRALPSWFGVEKSIVEYTHEVQQMPFYATYDGDNAIGFVAIKTHNEYTAEVCVMAILEVYHIKGIGRRLIESCVEYCELNKLEFLTVKTLDVSANYEPYDRTRNFYRKMGFVPLEVFPLHWDKENPCLFLAKYIGR